MTEFVYPCREAETFYLRCSMARRIGLRDIGHDILSAFISRNNDVRGYWTLGQLRNAMESNGVDLLVMTPAGEDHVRQVPEYLGLSERFSTMFRNLLSSHRLKHVWVQHAWLTIEMVASDRMRCSLRVVSDLGKTFDQYSDVTVLRHDPAHEFKRAD